MIPAPRLAGSVSTLKRSQRPLLVCHRKPDGDALGATLGLGSALSQTGKETSYFCVDPPPKHYRFLPGVAQFQSKLPAVSPDLIVMLDCSEDHLSGLDTAQLTGDGPLIDIDHHPKSGRLPSVRLAVYDEQASSTAEIVYAILVEARAVITRDIATNLLAGIIFDTSAFQNSNTSPQTLRVASSLLRRGARLKEIIKQSFYTSSVPKLRLWGTAMARIEQNAKAGGIVSTVLTHQDIAECGASPDDTEGLVNFLNAIPGIPALLLLTEVRYGEIKGSLRTRDERIDVSKLAKLLGGGGHRQASGFSLPGNLARQPDDSWVILPPPASSGLRG